MIVISKILELVNSSNKIEKQMPLYLQRIKRIMFKSALKIGLEHLKCPQPVKLCQLQARNQLLSNRQQRIRIKNHQNQIYVKFQTQNTGHAMLNKQINHNPKIRHFCNNMMLIWQKEKNLGFLNRNRLW